MYTHAQRLASNTKEIRTTIDNKDMNNNIQLLMRSPLVSLIRHFLWCVVYVAVTLTFIAAACHLHDM
jgi:hypothetical protein